MQQEIVLDVTKPETEWVRGRALRKVSPTYRHGLTQRRLATALGAWAEQNDCGRVAPEWRFRVTPPGEVTRPLVPDVAYVSFEALPKATADEDVDVPRQAPTVAIEVLSPDDRMDDVRDKVETYLAAGTSAVMIVDPERETAAVWDVSGVRNVVKGEALTHSSLPGFSLGLSEIFAKKF